MVKSIFFILFFASGSMVAATLCRDGNPLIFPKDPSKTPNASSAPSDLNPRISIQEKEDQEKDRPKKRIVIPIDDDKANERKDFMRIKMQSSQLILEGLTTNNFRLVQQGTNQIREMTKSEKWVAIDNEFYRKLVGDFESATDRLNTAAQSKNIDATAFRYYQLTTNCIDCHQHIRSAEYEF